MKIRNRIRYKKVKDFFKAVALGITTLIIFMNFMIIFMLGFNALPNYPSVFNQIEWVCFIIIASGYIGIKLK